MSSHSSSVGSFEYDSTDAEDDFQLIDPNTSAALSPTQRAPASSSSSPSPSTSTHPSSPVPLSHSTGSLPSRPPARRRRKKLPDDPSSSHSTSSLPHPSSSPSAPSPLPPASDPSAWGLRSHIAGYNDRNWAVQPHQSGGSLPPPPTPLPAQLSPSMSGSINGAVSVGMGASRGDLASSLGSSWSGSVVGGVGGGVGGSGGMEYEEGEEMQEEVSEGFDDEAAQFPQSSVTSLQPSVSVSDVEEGRDSEEEDKGSAQASGKEEKKEEASVAAVLSMPAAVAQAPGSPRPSSPLLAHRALPLFSIPAVLSYSPRQQPLGAVGAAVPGASWSGSSAASSSSAFSSSSSSSSLPVPHKADADSLPLPYFPWLSPRTLRHMGYAAIGLVVFVGLVRFGVMPLYGKATAFHVAS